MRRRRNHRRRKNKSVRNKVIVCFAMTFLLATGYSAFQTNITLNAKGTIKDISEKPQPESCFQTSTNADNTITITGYDVSTCGTSVVIPSKINGMNVTRVADGNYNSANGTFSGPFYNMGIKSLILPNTLKYIGYVAFRHNQIKTLEIPSSVTDIKIYAFNGNGMTSLKLNEGIININDQAFSDNYLTEVEIPSSTKMIGQVTFARNNITNIIFKGNRSNINIIGGSFAYNNLVGDNAYIYDYNSDGTVNNTIINSYAGKSMNGNTMPSSIVKIKHYAFANVTYNNLVLGENVEEIGNYAFDNCKIQSVTLNNKIKKMGYNVFNGNDSLKEITLPSSIETISNSAFSGSGIETININKGENAISGAPWGATKAIVNWNG